jgi:hypothetical protein
MKIIYLTVDMIAGYRFSGYGDDSQVFSEDAKEGGWNFEDIPSGMMFDEDESVCSDDVAILGSCFDLDDEDDLEILTKIYDRYGIHELPENLKNLID